MKQIDIALQDATFKSGLIFLALASLTFVSTMLLGDKIVEMFTGSFFVIFAMFWVYLFLVFGKNKANYGKYFRFKNLRHNIILLQLANISAYSLNRSIPVFQDSTEWLTGLLVIYHAALLLYCFRKDTTEVDSLQYAILLTISVGSVFHLYEAIFVYQLYPITLFTFWFFGVSLLALVPVWHFAMAVHIMRRLLLTNADQYRALMLAGISIPLVMIGVYLGRWQHINAEIIRPYTVDEPLSENIYPNWVESAQTLQDDVLTKRILKAGSVFQTSRQFMFLNNFNLNNERRQHDPFLVIATFFYRDISWHLRDEDRVRLLNTLYDQRHQTARKLWRSDNLVTEKVKTQVQLFPEYRLAYTEKTITILNQKVENAWRGQQEALYTFHLPEGAVVSSASLWIEGEERPALLTTRAKADSAYTAIVGVESRDPLLVHWQEGNQVTARIFPVMPAETRQFKIGFTAPMKLDGQKLIYENIDFAGPFWQFAEEEISIVSSGEVADIQTPWSFSEAGNNWTYTGSYKSDWQLSFTAPPLASERFAFNGRGFQLQAYQAQLSPFQAEAIYLDINSDWSKKELHQLWSEINDKVVYVYTNRLEQVTPANHKRLFKLLLHRRFSLFPFFSIDAPEKALVVSASGRLTPNLSDLEGSQFAISLNTFLQARSGNIKFFNLGEELSPYLRSLRDLRLFDYEQGELPTLIERLAQGQFVSSSESSSQITNHYAQLNIRETEATTSSAAPDHLLRLYAYNDLMKKIGKDYFNKDRIADRLIAQAAEAHVVTPVSSLIVLETQADYDRFGIEESENSLGNASIKSSGSVPEPHEWLLIVLSLLLMTYLWRKEKVKLS